MTDKLIQEILSTVADGYDSVRPGAGDCVREFAAEKYPDGEVFAQRLANLCDRHKREILPIPTAPICLRCEAELKARID